MLVIESRFFFHNLFYKKSTFSNLASSGLIRRNFAISRINWLENKFFFSFVFSFSFFYEFHRSKSLTLNLKFGFFHFHYLFLGEWGRSILGILLNRTLLFFINNRKSSGTLSMIKYIKFICIILILYLY